MSYEADFEKELKRLGAIFVRHGGDPAIYQLGSHTFPVRHRWSGGRQYENDVAQLKRIAREQGPIVAKPKPPAVGTAEGQRVSPRSRPELVRTARATPEEVAAWNRAEEAGWRMAMDDDTRVETEAKRTRVPLEDRLPHIDRVLREADRPMSAKEIAAVLGWTSERSRATTLQALRQYSRRYQPIKGQKRNERWVLRTEPPPSEAGAAPLAPPLAATADVSAASAEPAIVAATAIELIQSAIAEWKDGGFDPTRAVFTLGRIEGLLDQTPNPPTPHPAAE